ncbi:MULTISPECIES: eCIS core domain-containing protein [unclassified Coleofasciculus]|uniref:eCIS core domain-containing protein n=1 Tax=unclassified Coleofasciculus TaxID=2692782 RepID=UPI00187E3AC0|nr:MULTISPECIES: DUF4157 domain-containing protein [unclassified Coleofasciculus]MBE9129621.1 DUF4157 domain-containing protein [Coleofasciculus sp. LEGE 07081]MBE9152155.1 DUF4157 domain-containing protein [Coleofasciculus sp. LEGE 07092]
MSSRRHISRKLDSDSTPVQNQFRPRAFGKGIQARQAELPTTNFLETRPFGVPNQGTSQQQETPSIQTQREQAERFGYNAANIPTFAPGTASPPPIQAKLTIGTPGDKYEQEADQVASQVVSQINAPQTQPSTSGQSVQREELPEEEELQMKPLSNSIQREEVPEEEELQMKPLTNSIQREELPEEEELQMKPLSNSIQREEVPEEEELQMKPLTNSIQREELPEEEELQMKPIVQRQSGGDGMAATPDLEESIQQARGNGQPLSDNIREPMEQAFGADFSGVKIHRDTQSDQLNRSIQARAFTTGQDVFFRQGEYNPGSKGGQELIAHEFTHVLQQNPSVIQSKIQRQDTGDIPGYGVSTEFGDYWVVPDDTQMSYNVEGEQITESEFADLQNTWDALQSGSGNIKISEADSAGNDYGGFQDKILEQFGKLLSRPTGRLLVIDLVNASQTVTIRPSTAQIYGGAHAIRGGAGTLENADGTPGTGGTTTIEIDPNLGDDDVVVYDAAGNEIPLPIFITLGHELIHAQHNAAGQNRRNLPASDAAYSNKEEEETIATGSLTENDLRNEHNLDERHGHAGRDTR